MPQVRQGFYKSRVNGFKFRNGGKMIEMDSDYCRIVEKSLTGERVVDEETFASLTILTERLERLRKLEDSFSNVTFSSAVEGLKSQKNAVAVG